MTEAWLANRYVLTERLVQNGHRRVWRAEDRLFQRPVLIKGVVGTAPAEAQQNLLDELHRLQQVRHPRIPAPLDLHFAANCPEEPQSEGLRFFTQEWIEGRSLRAMMGHLSLEDLRVCLGEILDIVAFLHHQGLTQLDLKPDHLLCTETGWFLVDLDQARPDDPLGKICLHGTLPYLAPEVLCGSPGSKRADLFGLGATFWEALLGESPPVVGSTLAEIGAHRRSHPWPIPCLEGAEDEAPRLVETLHRLLEPDPSARFPSAEAARAHLDQAPPDAWRTRTSLPNHVYLDERACMAQVKDQLVAARRASGGGLCLVGPRHSGRSRLLQELANHWQETSAPVLHLNSELHLEQPYQLGEVLCHHLEGLLGRPPSTPLALPAKTRRDSVEATRAAQIRWMVNRVLTVAERARPAVDGLVPILVDDLKALAPESLEMLETLAQVLPGRGLFLIAVLEEGVDDSSLLGLPRLILPPLSAEAVRQLVEQSFGAGALTSASALDRLMHRTEGRPGRIREALTHRWQNPNATLEDWQPADGAEQRRRLEEILPSDVVDQLCWLSILPEPFGRQEWAATCAAETNGLAIARLESTGILIRRSGLHGLEARWHFESETLRGALETSLSSDQSLECHRRVLRFLQELSFQQAVPARRLAHHFVRAKLPEGARSALQAALKEAEETGRLEEAVDHARALLPQLPSGSRAVCVLHARMGRWFHQLRRYAEAENAWLASLERDGGATVARDAPRLAGLGKTLTYLGKLETAQAALSRALASGGEPALGVAARVDGLHQLAFVTSQQGNHTAASRCLAQAAEQKLTAGSRVWVDQCYLETLVAHQRGAGDDSHLESLQGAIKAAQKLDDPDLELKLLNLRAAFRRARGQVALAAEDLEQVRRRARVHFALKFEAGAARNLGELHQTLGQMEEALKAFEASATGYERLGNWDLALRARMRATGVLARAGRSFQAREQLTRARALLERGVTEQSWQTLMALEEEIRSSASVVISHETPGDNTPTHSGNGQLLEHAADLLKYVEHLLGPEHDEQELAAGLARLAGKLIGGRGLVFLFEGDTPVFVRGDESTPEERRDISASIIRRVQQSGKPCLYPDILAMGEGRRLSSLRETTVRSIYCSPVVRSGVSVGALYVDHRDTGLATSPEARQVVDRLAHMAGNLLEAMSRSPESTIPPNPLGLVSESPVMVELWHRLKRLLVLDELPRIILLGDPGVGKSWLARKIHLARGGTPDRFVEVDCGAIPEGIFESEFFGCSAQYSRSGAPVTGFFERARGGTLFLDEIGNLPLHLQTRLLTPLSNPGGHYRALGSDEQRPLQCDVICGTNANLNQRVADGLFRRDLRDRVQEVQYRLPSLEERGPADVRLLSQLFLARRLKKTHGEDVRLEHHLTPTALRFLLTYSWPSNIRQLWQIWTKQPDIGVRLDAGLTVRRSDLQHAADAYEARRRNVREDREAEILTRGMTWAETKERLLRVQVSYVRQVLQEVNGNKSEAARRLKVTRPRLHEILKRFAEEPSRSAHGTAE